MQIRFKMARFIIIAHFVDKMVDIYIIAVIFYFVNKIKGFCVFYKKLFYKNLTYLTELLTKC